MNPPNQYSGYMPNPFQQQGSQYGPPPQNQYRQQYGPQGNQIPPNQYSQQPQYGQQGMQPNYGPQNYGPPQFRPIPGFSLLGRGTGIDEREFDVITHAAEQALNLKEDPLSNGIINRIKQQIGGEWMAFASVKDLKGYDFSLSIVTGNDFLNFIIQNFRFQVCRLRD